DELVGKAEADSLRQANGTEPPAPSHESQLQSERALRRLRNRYRHFISRDTVLRGDEHLPDRAEAVDRKAERVARPLGQYGARPAVAQELGQRLGRSEL